MDPSRNAPDSVKTVLSQENSALGSRTLLKASVIAPRDIFDRLPEALLHYLNEGIDRGERRRLRLSNPNLLHTEEVLTDRLFPLYDERPFIRQMRNHSRATAIAARVIAESVGLAPDTTYLCGLLHDIGIASCVRHADEIRTQVSESALPQLWPTFARSAATHAIALTTRWRLPSGFRFAIRDHVCFDTLTSPSLIAAATVIAEHLAGRLGFPFGQYQESPTRLVEMARDRLGLVDGDRDDVIREIGNRLNALTIESKASDSTLRQQSLA